MAKYGESKGYYFREDDDGKLAMISPEDYAAGITAQDTGPVEAAFVSAGRRIANLGNKFGADIEQAPDNVMNALSQEHPVASTVGDVAPYLASAPLLGTIGIPGAVALGAAEGYGFSNEGSEVFDTTMGGLGAPIGNMAGRVVQRIGKAVGIGTPAFREPLLTTQQRKLGKQGYWDRNLADTIGGGGSARLFGRENQGRMNKLVGEALGLDPKAVNRLDPSQLHAGKAAIQAELDDLIKYNNRLMDIPQNIRSRDHFTQANARINDAMGRSKVIDLALNSIDDAGNINPGKWVDANRAWEKKFEASALPGMRPQVPKLTDTATERAKVLTDPKLGAVTHKIGKSEEVVADMFRTGLTPTGWAGILNFLPALAPTGAGGAMGTAGGLLAPTSLLDQAQNRNDLPDDIR